MDTKTAKIRELNDNLRIRFIGGLLVFSAGVSAESPELRAKIVQAMQKFRDFCPENDPYGEHDFGKISVEDGEYFWKIDYYDLDYRFLSPGRRRSGRDQTGADAYEDRRMVERNGAF